jgi:hypothetical protein
MLLILWYCTYYHQINEKWCVGFQTMFDLYRRSLGYVVVGLSCFLALPCGVLAQKQSKLPAGYYIFMGRQPGSSPPKAVVINDDGSIHWQDVGKAPVAQSDRASNQAPQPVAKSGQLPENHSGSQWEMYKYPMIRWRPHPITTVPGGVAQLTTTFDSTAGSYSEAAVKYKLTLFNVPEIPYDVQVQLLDGNGFKVLEFQVYQSAFHPVPGTSLIEVSDECTCTEKAYKQARDYTVK